ncbi:helix-turn-helix domain-containing protein [Streptomyces sp. ISL-11]|uniref:helix-turn-helix domain-containing protein n=1 Tax=Streptomyces sp. ISL-11 TaxID=2819174 RepID=UPI0027E597D4|nr:helix-turn-helix domain-containing protein [Streptomyces sp. ISL-11]
MLEADVLHRARLLAQGGIQQLSTDLDPRVSWSGGRLSVEHRYGGGGRRLGGRGLLLIPSAFVWPRLFSVTVPHRQPTLRYPPRGVATLWERREREPAQALAAVLGRSRARLLTELDAPAATAELARRTGITAGGVSQHLGALRAAGLVAAARAGRQVLYRRAEAAEVLLNAAERDPGRPGPASC